MHPKQRLLNEWGWHHDRGNLGRFVEEPTIAPTNNPAERARRPAVIARKVSQGSNHGAGAHACEAFINIVRTLANKRADSLVEDLYQLFRSTSLHVLPHDPSARPNPLINYRFIPMLGAEQPLGHIEQDRNLLLNDLPNDLIDNDIITMGSHIAKGNRPVCLGDAVVDHGIGRTQTH